MLGYLLCLAVLSPALSLEIFLGVLAKTPRQHDVLALLGTTLQLLVSVTSPVKIALMLCIVLCASAVQRATLALKAPPTNWYGDGI